MRAEDALDVIVELLSGLGVGRDFRGMSIGPLIAGESQALSLATAGVE